MHHKAIEQPAPGCELTDTLREDIQTQHAVLGVVMDGLPCIFTVPELVREISPDDEDAVERAVRDLTRVGLLRREGTSLLPTRAATHFNLLVVVAQ